jgi:hypothetical protein
MLTRGLLFYDHAYRRYEIWLRTRGTRRLALQTQRAKVFERAASALFQVVGGDKEETEEVVIGAQPGSPG